MQGLRFERYLWMSPSELCAELKPSAAALKRMAAVAATVAAVALVFLLILGTAGVGPLACVATGLTAIGAAPLVIAAQTTLTFLTTHYLACTLIFGAVLLGGAALTYDRICRAKRLNGRGAPAVSIEAQRAEGRQGLPSKEEMFPVLRQELENAIRTVSPEEMAKAIQKALSEKGGGTFTVDAERRLQFVLIDKGKRLKGPKREPQKRLERIAERVGRIDKVLKGCAHRADWEPLLMGVCSQISYNAIGLNQFADDANIFLIDGTYSSDEVRYLCSQEAKKNGRRMDVTIQRSAQGEILSLFVQAVYSTEVRAKAKEEGSRVKKMALYGRITYTGSYTARVDQGAIIVERPKVTFQIYPNNFKNWVAACAKALAIALSQLGSS